MSLVDKNGNLPDTVEPNRNYPNVTSVKVQPEVAAEKFKFYDPDDSPETTTTGTLGCVAIISAIISIFFLFGFISAFNAFIEGGADTDISTYKNSVIKWRDEGRRDNWISFDTSVIGLISSSVNYTSWTLIESNPESVVWPTPFIPQGFKYEEAYYEMTVPISSILTESSTFDSDSETFFVSYFDGINFLEPFSKSVYRSVKRSTFIRNTQSAEINSPDDCETEFAGIYEQSTNLCHRYYTTQTVCIVAQVDEASANGYTISSSDCSARWWDNIQGIADSEFDSEDNDVKGPFGAEEIVSQVDPPPSSESDSFTSPSLKFILRSSEDPLVVLSSFRENQLYFANTKSQNGTVAMLYALAFTICVIICFTLIILIIKRSMKKRKFIASKTVGETIPSGPAPNYNDAIAGNPGNIIMYPTA